MTVGMREYTLALPPYGVHCVLMLLIGTPICGMCFIWSEYIIWVFCQTAGLYCKTEAPRSQFFQKGRSSTAKLGTKVVVLLGMIRCCSFSLFSEFIMGLYPCNDKLPPVTPVFNIMNFRWGYHGRLAGWRKWRACDVGEAKKGLENELWRRWSNGRVGEWAVI